MFDCLVHYREKSEVQTEIHLLYPAMKVPFVLQISIQRRYRCINHCQLLLSLLQTALINILWKQDGNVIEQSVWPLVSAGHWIELRGVICKSMRRCQNWRSPWLPQVCPQVPCRVNSQGYSVSFIKLSQAKYLLPFTIDQSCFQWFYQDAKETGCSWVSFLTS